MRFSKLEQHPRYDQLKLSLEISQASVRDATLALTRAEVALQKMVDILIVEYWGITVGDVVFFRKNGVSIWQPAKIAEIVSSPDLTRPFTAIGDFMIRPPLKVCLKKVARTRTAEPQFSKTAIQAGRNNWLTVTEYKAKFPNATVEY